MGLAPGEAATVGMRGTGSNWEGAKAGCCVRSGGCEIPYVVRFTELIVFTSEIAKMCIGEAGSKILTH